MRKKVSHAAPRLASHAAPRLKALLLGLLVLSAACTDSCGCSKEEIRDELSPRMTELEPSDLAARLWPNDGPKRYVEDIPDRISSIAVLVKNAASQAASEVDPAFLDKLAKRAGFIVEYWRVSDRRYMALLEMPAHRTGIGAYVFRIGPRGNAEREYLLQAPHSFFDLGTGKLALSLFLASGDHARGLFVNTLHRYTQSDGSRQEEQDNPADVTHNFEHPFAVATEAAARGLEDLEVIQVHGFDESGVKGKPQAVVSAGDAAGSSQRSTAVAARLAKDFGIDAKRFPEETQSLGATQNVEVARLRTVFGTSFVHVELSKAVRKSVKDNDARILVLAHALLGLEPA